MNLILQEGLVGVQNERQKCEEYKEQSENFPKCTDISQYIAFFSLEVLVLHSYQSKEMSVLYRYRPNDFQVLLILALIY